MGSSFEKLFIACMWTGRAIVVIIMYYTNVNIKQIDFLIEFHWFADFVCAYLCGFVVCFVARMCHNRFTWLFVRFICVPFPFQIK